MRGRKDNLIHKRFGRLLVMSSAPSLPQTTGATRWNCLCDCGKYKAVSSVMLKRGTISCGCFAKEISSIVHKKHGMRNSPTYAIWRGMKKRCLNETAPQYHNYGGRGITICTRWLKFEIFLADMGEQPKEMQIDRIDNSKGYFRENCRWTTAQVNANNRRTNVVVTLNGESRTLKEWSRKSGIKYTTVHARLRRGWSFEQSINL